MEIELVVTDFDGVMTDNKLMVDKNGNEFATCHKADGWGIFLLKQTGVQVACLTTGTPIAKARCDKLKIDCLMGGVEKQKTLEGYLLHKKIKPENCVYVGNDTNDLNCLNYVRYGVIPVDADKSLLENACNSYGTLVNPLKFASDRKKFLCLPIKGGEGVIREVARMVMELNK